MSNNYTNDLRSIESQISRIATAIQNPRANIAVALDMAKYLHGTHNQDTKDPSVKSFLNLYWLCLQAVNGKKPE